MSDAMSHEDHPQLDEYLDGLMSPADRAAFESQVQADPVLRDLLDRQQQIDQALKRRFGPPPAGVALQGIRERYASARVESGHAPAAPRKHPVRAGGFGRQALAAAAIIAIFVFSGWRLWDHYGPKPDKYPPRPFKSLVQVYQDTLNTGLVPDWVCKTDEEFARTFGKQFGQPLLLGQTPAGVRAAGISYCNSLTPRTLVLLATVQDKPVLVFVDRADQDPGQKLPPDSPLHLFSRTIDKLVLYELSPLAQPHLLEFMYRPD
ncbi:MAG: anti-sigma factor family protein [Phycisphaerae bacterium]